MSPPTPDPRPAGGKHDWQLLDFPRRLFWCNGCGCLKAAQGGPSKYCPPGGNWSEREPACADLATLAARAAAAEGLIAAVRAWQTNPAAGKTEAQYVADCVRLGDAVGDALAAYDRAAAGAGCATCGRCADFLCDYPLGDGKTCSAPLCETHARSIGDPGEDVHLCPAHMAMLGVLPGVPGDKASKERARGDDGPH